MARNVFISFRYADGHKYKKQLSELFDHCNDTVDFSEDVNRSNCSEQTIRDYLYKKLRRSSVTIVLLTPEAINHHKDYYGNYDDWMYDEIRYSLENRAENRVKGLIAVYTDEAKPYLIDRGSDARTIKNVDNLFRVNMMNIKPEYKKCPKDNIFDCNYDSYCSLVYYQEFVRNVGDYIDIAEKKRNELYKYNLKVRL